MFDDLKTKIKSVFSSNGIDLYNEYYDIDALKNYNKNIGFLSVKEIEKINSYQNSLELKSFEVFVTVECKVIAKKGMTSDSFSQTMDNVFTDFLLSNDVIPVSLKMESLKINSLYSRLESNLIFRFRYYLSDTAQEV